MPPPQSLLAELRALEAKRAREGLTPAEQARLGELRAVALPASGRGFDVSAAAEAVRESLLPAGLHAATPAAPPPEHDPDAPPAEAQDWLAWQAPRERKAAWPSLAQFDAQWEASAPAPGPGPEAAADLVAPDSGAGAAPEPDTRAITGDAPAGGWPQAEPDPHVAAGAGTASPDPPRPPKTEGDTADWDLGGRPQPEHAGARGDQDPGMTVSWNLGALADPEMEAPPAESTPAAEPQSPTAWIADDSLLEEIQVESPGSFPILELSSAMLVPEAEPALPAEPPLTPRFETAPDAPAPPGEPEPVAGLAAGPQPAPEGPWPPVANLANDQILEVGEDVMELSPGAVDTLPTLDAVEVADPGPATGSEAAPVASPPVAPPATEAAAIAAAPPASKGAAPSATLAPAPPWSPPAPPVLTPLRAPAPVSYPQAAPALAAPFLGEAPSFGERVPAPAARLVAGTHRVVVHTVEGLVRRGSLQDPDLLGEALALTSQPLDPPESIPVDRVRAIFFMLGPGEMTPPPEGRKIRVTFKDGRQVAGFSPDYDPAFPGFFMIPADTRSNTARIWVYRAGVRQVTVSD